MLIRAGHTEAAVDFSRLAGLNPSGVICEIMNEDGTMARMPELIRFAEQTGSKVVAEGVETDGELAVLRGLQVTNAQGFLLGMPQPLAASTR